ncbi:DUF3098 domain-containing protein [Sphingobacterium oryzagri]|uniref:DUF3098 domain-containing protein n=1 Tax=Sphingobacterium oryzagri TaxID=3025669 RepID=A0ABY7WPY7_9SPHI|nr:DUF3098 domain-containing protein [Sphingobacterium sp. KACC 22765]WDF70614.1 DUF3098 domain-containing protein [Sphingobacterium sp. KACC 22765]
MSEQKIKNSSLGNQAKAGFAFEKINYQLLIASIVVVLIGFILMMGTEDIYSFTKITLAPFVVVLGFALGFVAILYKPKTKNSQK